MGALASSEEQRAEGFLPPGPSLRGLIRWRLRFAGATLVAIVAVTVWGFYAAATRWFGESMVISAAVSYVIPLLLLGVLSLVIAEGLGRVPLRAIRWALVQDLLVLPVAVLAIISISRSPTTLEPLRALGQPALWLWAGLALAFSAEAAYLLRARWSWRPAWPVFGLLAAGLVSMAAILPPVLTARRAQDLRPLLDYVTRHWVRIPPGARLSMGQCSAAPGKHWHFIRLMQAERILLEFRAEHVRDGRWTLPKGQKYIPTFSIRTRPLYPVGSVDEAQELLRQCGMVDTSVRLERVIMEPDRSRVDEYEFWSPLAQGHYRVSHFGFIDLYLERPVELP